MNTILQVNPKIDEFMNYGMSYRVVYMVKMIGDSRTWDLNHFCTKNKSEAIEKQKELQLQAVFKFWD